MSAIQIMLAMRRTIFVMNVLCIRWIRRMLRQIISCLTTWFCCYKLVRMVYCLLPNIILFTDAHMFVGTFLVTMLDSADLATQDLAAEDPAAVAMKDPVAEGLAGSAVLAVTSAISGCVCGNSSSPTVLLFSLDSVRSSRGQRKQRPGSRKQILIAHFGCSWLPRCS